MTRSLADFGKIYYFDEDLYLTALPAIKISMLLTYLRVFQSKHFKWGVYVVIALNVCYGIAFLLVSIWQCRPIPCAWTHWTQEEPYCETFACTIEFGGGY